MEFGFLADLLTSCFTLIASLFPSLFVLISNMIKIIGVHSFAHSAHVLPKIHIVVSPPQFTRPPPQQWSPILQLKSVLYFNECSSARLCAQMFSISSTCLFSHCEWELCRFLSSRRVLLSLPWKDAPFSTCLSSAACDGARVHFGCEYEKQQQRIGTEGRCEKSSQNVRLKGMSSETEAREGRAYKCMTVGGQMCFVVLDGELSGPWSWGSYFIRDLCNEAVQSSQRTQLLPQTYQ